MKTIDEVLDYYNADVIEKFREEYYFDEREADKVFKEVLKWLWLAAQDESRHHVAMYHPMNVMDRMWHTFLSFTKDYSDFCTEYLGRFIHHVPHTRASSLRALTASLDGDDPLAKIMGEIAEFQSIVYDKLGQDTLIRWFATFPHVYSPDEINRRTRPQFSQTGFLQIASMKKMDKDALLKQLAKTNHIAAWCGGPGCGPQCMEA